MLFFLLFGRGTVTFKSFQDSCWENLRKFYFLDPLYVTFFFFSGILWNLLFIPKDSRILLWYMCVWVCFHPLSLGPFTLAAYILPQSLEIFLVLFCFSLFYYNFASIFSVSLLKWMFVLHFPSGSLIFSPIFYFSVFLLLLSFNFLESKLLQLLRFLLGEFPLSSSGHKSDQEPWGCGFDPWPHSVG